MSSNKKTEYTYKQIPIELIKTNKDSLEITDEALKLLFSLKNEKLFIITINGMSQSGKTALANNLIAKDKGFDAKKSTKGIWIWGTPINIKDNIKLLIIDCEGIKDNKINNFALLSILFSTHFIYNTKGDLNDNIINKYISNMNIKDLITFNINNKHNIPEIIFVNDLLKGEEIKNKIENNKSYINSDIKCFYKNQKYLQAKNIKEIINSINTSNNNFLDGDIFFGLIQNYIN